MIARSWAVDATQRTRVIQRQSGEWRGVAKTIHCSSRHSLGRSARGGAGTKMIFAGIKDEKEGQDSYVIAYLEVLK
jgi:hypothetical protein